MNVLVQMNVYLELVQKCGLNHKRLEASLISFHALPHLQGLSLQYP